MNVVSSRDDESYALSVEVNSSPVSAVLHLVVMHSAQIHW